MSEGDRLHGAGGAGGEGEETGEAPPLDFEAWMKVAVELLSLSRDERLIILDERKIEVSDWDASDQHWSMALAEDLSAGSMERPTRYGLACAAEMARRKEAKGAGDAKSEGAPLEEREQASQAPLPAASQPTPPLASTPPPLASTPPPLASPLPMTSPPAFVSPLPHPPPIAPLPVAPPPIAPLPVAPPSIALPAVVPAPAALAGTALALDVGAAIAAVLPFGSTPSPEFAKGEKPAPAAGGAKPPPKSPSPLGETKELGDNVLPALMASLPFDKTPPPEGRASRDSAPASSKARATAAPLTVEQYASLCAELAVYPDKKAEVLRKYYLADDAAYRALEKDWQVRFLMQPALRQEWQNLYSTFHGWLLKSRP